MGCHHKPRINDYCDLLAISHSDLKWSGVRYGYVCGRWGCQSDKAGYGVHNKVVLAYHDLLSINHVSGGSIRTSYGMHNLWYGNWSRWIRWQIDMTTLIFFMVHQGRKYIQKCRSAMLHHILSPALRRTVTCRDRTWSPWIRWQIDLIWF